MVTFNLLVLGPVDSVGIGRVKEDLVILVSRLGEDDWIDGLRGVDEGVERQRVGRVRGSQAGVVVVRVLLRLEGRIELICCKARHVRLGVEGVSTGDGDILLGVVVSRHGPRVEGRQLHRQHQKEQHGRHFGHGH